jgi:hypothetical protein
MKRLLLPILILALLTLVLLLIVAAPASAGTKTPYTATQTMLYGDPEFSEGYAFPLPPYEYGPSAHIRDYVHVMWYESTDFRVTGRGVVDVSIDANYWPWVTPTYAPVQRSHATTTLYVQERLGGDILGVWEGTTVGEWDLVTGISTLHGQARGVSGVVKGLRRVFTVTETPLSNGDVEVIETGYLIKD